MHSGYVFTPVPYRRSQVEMTDQLFGFPICVDIFAN